MDNSNQNESSLINHKDESKKSENFPSPEKPRGSGACKGNYILTGS